MATLLIKHGDDRVVAGAGELFAVFAVYEGLTDSWTVRLQLAQGPKVDLDCGRNQEGAKRLLRRIGAAIEQVWLHHQPEEMGEPAEVIDVAEFLAEPKEAS